MSSERKDWCKDHCPIYSGYGACSLDAWIEGGWSSNRRKKEIRQEFDELAEKNPEELIRECMDKSLSV